MWKSDRSTRIVLENSQTVGMRSFLMRFCCLLLRFGCCIVENLTYKQVKCMLLLDSLSGVNEYKRRKNERW